MRKSGITKTTPEEFLLNAGTVFKNFAFVWRKATQTGEEGEYEAGAIQIVADDAPETDDTIRLWKIVNPKVSFIKRAADYQEPKVGDYIIGAWDDSDEYVLGATSGGNKISILSELMQIDVDGALVKVKGLTQKIGEAGSMESNLAQHNKESFIRSIIGKVQDSLLKGMTQITTKSLIEASDYLDNIAYVGTMSNGTECIIIMENALCTNGFEIEPKNKDKAVLKVTFECNADFDDAHDTLPIYIFVPNKAKEEA